MLQIGVDDVRHLIEEVKELVAWQLLPLKVLVSRSDAADRDRGDYLAICLQHATCGYGDNPTTAVLDSLRRLLIHLHTSKRRESDPVADLPVEYRVAFASGKQLKLDDKALSEAVHAKAPKSLIRELEDQDVFQIRKTSKRLPLPLAG